MTITTEYSYATMPDGLRVVHVRRPSLAEYCGMAVRAGSRDENDKEAGLAHFVEHTIFKGTSRRRAHHIINRMEAVGGELNAYTTKEETMIYSVFPSGNLARAVELIADLVCDSVFPDNELDKEREVVAEEIDSYLDTPADAVYDDFEDLILAGTPLGHNILGSAETLGRFDSEMCRGFVDRFYTAQESVFFYLGPAEPQKVFSMVRRHFDRMRSTPRTGAQPSKPHTAPFAIRRGDADTHQAHNIIGAIVPSMFSPDRYALALLNNILGGPGMNSRLNVALRERRGLVYSVDSSTSLYSDCGLLTIYFGCNPDDTVRCRRLIDKELYRLATRPLSPRELDAAKRQYAGQLTVGASASEQTVLSAARATLFKGRAKPTDEVIELINEITADDILRVASMLTPDKCSSLTLG